MPKGKITELFAAFEKVKTYCLSKRKIDMKALQKLSNLTEVELKPILQLLKVQE